MGAPWSPDLFAAAAKTEDVATWLEALSWLALGLASLCAAAIAYDIFARGYRQPMGIMNAVYPITALYWGPLAVWFYRRYGRPKSPRARAEEGRTGAVAGGDGLAWNQVAEGDSHCGAGCTLGDVIGEWTVFVTASESR